jgi:multidrug efflux pump subunit AcrA (membrane-fusion protein)
MSIWLTDTRTAGIHDWFDSALLIASGVMLALFDIATLLTRSLAANFGALSAILAASFLFFAASKSSAADPPKTDPAGLAVSVIRAKKICFDKAIEITGALVPQDEILVWPDRDGLQISKVLVEVGTKVRPGQPLAQLIQPDVQQGLGDSVSVQAPVAGVVEKSTAVIGAIASARTEPLFQIIARGELEFSAQLAAPRLSNLSLGLPAIVRVVGVGEIPGRVGFVSRMIDPTTQLGEVKIAIGSDERLKAGAFGRAIINAGQRCDNAAVPLSAVLYGPEGAVAQVVHDETIETRLITAGLKSKGNVEILQGISEGDMVVVRAGAFLRDGDRVRSFVVGEPLGQKKD